jgi:hypothetical protein
MLMTMKKTHSSSTQSNGDGFRADATLPLGIANATEVTKLERHDGRVLWSGLGCNETEVCVCARVHAHKYAIP